MRRGVSPGVLIFAGGVLVGAGVALGVWMSPRFARTRVEEPRIAPDPPVRRGPNYELLREPVVASPKVPALAKQLIATATVTSTSSVAATVAVKEGTRPVEAARAGARPEPKTPRKSPPFQKIEPKFSPAALEEAKSMLAEIEALKHAPDAELRDRVRALSTRPATEERVIAARDRCAKAYQSLLDGLDRLERITEEIAKREAAGGATDVPELRAELERADTAAEAAKRGVLACEVGLARLRAAYGLSAQAAPR